MKRYISILACLAILYSFASCVSDGGTQTENNVKPKQAELNNEILNGLSSETIQYTSTNIEYEYNVYNTYVEISRYISNDLEVSIPTEIEGLPVKIIGEEAFKDTVVSNVIMSESVVKISSSAFAGCEFLNTVTIPDSVLSIGHWTFRDCYSLSEITLPDKITFIGEGTFARCSSLASINIPENVEYIGCYAFEDSRLIGVEFPDSVVTIDDCAFRNCFSLQNVAMSSNVRQIGLKAFYFCDALYEIELPVGIEYIGQEAFHGTGMYRNPQYWEDNRYFYLGDYLLEATETYNYTGGPIYESNIREGTTLIAGWAFYGLTNLTSVTIPDSVQYIGEDAFGNCTSLTNVRLSESLKSIEYGVFSGCTSLESIVIPESVINIKTLAFLDCKNLKNIDVGKNVESIGERAFDNCRSLESIVLPDKVTIINRGVFLNCKDLKQIELYGNIEEIADNAFEGVEGLTIYTYNNSIVFECANRNGFSVVEID